ncbi:amino acid ABC transporter permease [Salinibacterium sp. SYSU T00001]|uniref:amino acid ABC transporter permease n=1 Tax=Homoserinimonas sedimenticola TaxID=2986805 RepID=UPI00223625D0|nr:amino acid ABC transporter permease [Salinibacterium sedimenticola]MCW4386792.1 amino acid ABC transporter permease [Salinibacterium sedimenticola]
MTSVLYDAPGPKARRRSLIISIVGVIVILGGLAALIAGLAAPRVSANGTEQPGLFDASRWDIFLDVQVWRFIGEGVLNTLRMAAVAAVFAIVVGILFSFGRSALTPWVRTPSTVLLEFFRGMPVLLLILFILLVFGVEPYWAGVGALALYNGAIIGEALRAGIQSLPKGQRESGLAIGLTPLRTRFIIEFPQAFRQMLPIIIAQLVVLLKDTALAYIVGYPELLRTTTTYIANFFGSRYVFSLFFVALAIYLTMNLLLSWVARLIAKRSGPKLGKTIGAASDKGEDDPQFIGGRVKAENYGATGGWGPR